MTKRTCETLILLVGSNPLPNYLAACMLMPRFIWLVYTEETKDVKDILAPAIRVSAPSVERIEEKYCPSDTEAAKVRSAIQELPLQGAHLHYTGGTKVMAAQARLVFAKEGRSPSDASYLDEREQVLLFDDSDSQELADSGIVLTIDQMIGLHGFKRIGSSGRSGNLTEADAEAIALSTFAAPDRPRQPNEPKWLDAWLRAQVRETDPSCEVDTNLYLERCSDRRQVEVDVVAVRGQRLYLISTTLILQPHFQSPPLEGIGEQSSRAMVGHLELPSAVEEVRL